MIRKLQVIYGYLLIISFFYLLFVAANSVVSITVGISLTMSVVFLSLIRISPHPDYPNYPFSFCVRWFFQDQKQRS